MGHAEAQAKEEYFKNRMPRNMREKIVPLSPLVGHDVVVHTNGPPIHGKLIAVRPSRSRFTNEPVAQLVLLEQEGERITSRVRDLSDPRLVEDASTYKSFKESKLGKSGFFRYVHGK